jgi:hypothetical protein
VRTITLVAILATVAVVGGAAGGVATADPDAGCIGTERGAAFQADSGFTVWYNDSEPMPSNGVFQGDDTLRFRDVTLTSGAATELVLEDGTGPETCLGGIDAGAAPIVIDPDGEQAVRVGGQVRALSVADAQYGDGAADLAYDATSEWSIVVTDTGFGQGTTIEAVDAGGSTLATGTVDGSGAVRLTLPSGTYDVALREESGTQSDGGTDSGGDGGDGGSDGSGDDSSDTGGNTTDDGSGDGSTSGSDDGGSDGTGDDSDGGDGGLPWLLIGGGLAAVLIAGGVGYVLNGDGGGDASGGDGTASPDTEEAVPQEAGSAAGAPAAAESSAANDAGSEPADVEDANADESESADASDAEDTNVEESEPADGSDAEDEAAAEGRGADDEHAGDTEEPSEE